MKKKTILITAVLSLIGISSGLAITPKGPFFKAEYCSGPKTGGAMIGLVAISQVCLGKVALIGAPSEQSPQAAQLRLNDGTVRVFRIETMAHAGPGGFSGTQPATITFFGGTLPGAQPADRVNGTYRTNGISTIFIDLSTVSNFKFQGTLNQVN